MVELVRKNLALAEYDVNKSSTLCKQCTYFFHMTFAQSGSIPLKDGVKMTV